MQEVLNQPRLYEGRIEENNSYMRLICQPNGETYIVSELGNLASSMKVIVLLGLRYLASSIPLISLVGVAIGVGIIFAFLVFSISRNPSIINNLIRWSFIGFSLVEVSGFIGLIYSFLLLYALSG